MTRAPFLVGAKELGTSFLKDFNRKAWKQQNFISLSSYEEMEGLLSVRWAFRNTWNGTNEAQCVRGTGQVHRVAGEAEPQDRHLPKALDLSSALWTSPPLSRRRSGQLPALGV